MKRTAWLVVVIALLVRVPEFARTRPAATPIATESRRSTPGPVASPAQRSVGPTGVVLPAADPMATELQRELERAQRDYAALFRRLAQARDEAEALAIQAEMREQRVGLEVALLRIQAAYARRAGRRAYAGQLERAIAALIEADPAPPAVADPRRGL